MAVNLTIHSPRFPVGTSVGLYSALEEERARVGQVPQGPVLQTAVVAADGSVTFTGLVGETLFFAYAVVSGENRWVGTSTPTDTAFRILSRLAVPSAQVPSYVTPAGSPAFEVDDEGNVLIGPNLVMGAGRSHSTGADTGNLPDFWWSADMRRAFTRTLYVSEMNDPSEVVLRRAGCPTTTLDTGGVTLPAATILVTALGDAFPSSGTMDVDGQTVTYTGWTTSPSPRFTGCSGGTGAHSAGALVTINNYPDGSPIGTLAGDTIGMVGWAGWRSAAGTPGTVQGGGFGGRGAMIYATAAENIKDGANAMDLHFATTPQGTAVIREWVRLTSEGRFRFLEGSSLVLPPVVTSLPVGPIDGQTCIFQVDEANGVYWHLRFREGSASAYKWEVIGGSALFAEVTTSEATTSTTYANLSTVGPQLTLPLAGDYDIRIGASASGSVPSIEPLMSYSIGGSGATDNEAAHWRTSDVAGSGNMYAPGVRTRRKTGLGAVALAAKYRTAGAGTVRFQDRWMEVRPVRVG